MIEFNQLAIKNSGGDEDILNRVMTKDNIALAAVFKTIVPSNGKFRNHICFYKLKRAESSIEIF